MSAPYRAASRHGCLMVVLLFGGIALGILLAAQLKKDEEWWKYALAFGVPCVVTITAGVVITNRLQKGRLDGIKAIIAPRGYRVVKEPDASQKDVFFAPVAYLVDWYYWRQGANAIQWLAASPDCGVFEHLYLTGSGKTTQEHLHTVALFPLPAHLTEGVIARRSGWRLRRQFRNSPDKFSTGDAAFDKNWTLVGGAELGKQFLNSNVRRLLADSPVGESWMVGGGYLCAVYQATFDGANLVKFLDRAERVWQAYVNA